ncbi:gfo/Idh/MocA family oxidoreductase [Arenibacter sp. N53]|uniref:Gfo/Idh/MocA family protein n=1 Tax=Arenibacter TaxID=178469 RepID=UPI000CD4793E|nr:MULTISPECIES: Gfo/Idh/MocA family oxidoreductase [Arenibacter]MCM4154248.1 gfo/Idh/MocA family oxidoreductase [Arenibacter sp. N53]
MKKQQKSVSRRRFLDSITTAALAVPFLGTSAISLASPKDKLKHACIGVGGMGWHDLQNFKQHPDVQIVALCDVDAKNLQKAAELFPDARTYSDWRKLLKKEHDNIDSVNVTVPDHNHFAIAYQAIQNGKHVYCQKPLCHDVVEVRKLTEASIKAGVMTQLGTHHASGKGDRSAVQIIKDGVIGKIKHAYLCSNRPAAIETYRLPGPRPPQGQDVPSHLNWDLWTGTAPMRPYAPKIYHPAIWRAWQDFGTGWSGDIGCHIFDAVWKGLGLKAPMSVVAKVQESWKTSSQRNVDTWPQGDHITWMFPGNEFTESDVLPLEWFDGEFYPPWEIQALFHGKPYPAESAILIGTEGALLIPHGDMPVLLPENKYTDYEMPKLDDRNHYHHFVDACLGGEKTESHFAQSGPMTEAILLGTVAIRIPDKVLEWDAANMLFPKHPEANKYLQREYRKGWSVAGF